MQFPFTFTLNVPGSQNPFLATPGLVQSRIDALHMPVFHQISPVPPSRFPPANILSPPLPLSRKRGWVPSEPEPSHAAASATSTTGYLDTPAKYMDMPQGEPEQEAQVMNAELPPAKRRRTLAGSIVSTALNAALFGTAVGLTVYRLWRDRGRLPEQLPPPPPYQRGDWVPDVAGPPKQIELTPTALKTRKPHPTPASVRRTIGRHHRKARARLQIIPPSRSVSPAYTPHSDPDFTHVNYQTDDIEPDLEPEMDQMDWIGDRLGRLIEDGRKALGREIVVMSDAKEDEVDDGSDGWEEEEDDQRGSIRSLRRTHRPRDLPLPPSSSPYLLSHPSSASPRKRHFDTESVRCSPARSTYGGCLTVPSTPRRVGRGTSVESDAFPIVSSFKEDESAWQSPELRESMEQARARYLLRRGQ